MFGQELFFGGFDKNAIQNALQVSFLKHHYPTVKSSKIVLLSYILSFLKFMVEFFVSSINQGK